MIKEYQTKSGKRYRVIVSYKGMTYRKNGIIQYDEALSLERRRMKMLGSSVVLMFEDVVKEFLEFYCKCIKSSTAVGVRYNFNKHILNHIPSKYFVDVTRDDVETWWNYIKQSYLVQKNRYLGYMKRVFKYASDVYHLDNNACSLLTPYKDYSIHKNDTKQSKSLSIDEFRRLMRVVDDSYYRLAYYMGYFLGLRIGELLGLQVECFKGERLYIYQQLRPYGNREVFSLKTRDSQRFYILPEFMLKDVKTHIEVNQLTQQDFIFFSTKQKILPISETSFNRKLKYYNEKSGIRKISFHYFRHSEASLIFNSGVSLNVIRDYLGHSSSDTTKKYYISQNEKDKSDIASFQNILYENMQKA